MENFADEYFGLTMWAVVSLAIWIMIGVTVLFTNYPDAPFYFFSFLAGLILFLPIPLFIIRFLWERHKGR